MLQRHQDGYFEHKPPLPGRRISYMAVYGVADFRTCCRPRPGNRERRGSVGIGNIRGAVTAVSHGGCNFAALRLLLLLRSERDWLISDAGGFSTK